MSAVSTTLSVKKELLGEGKVTLHWGNAVVIRWIELADQANLDLQESCDRILVVTVCDGLNFSFQRYILTASLGEGSNVFDIVPNANFTKLAVSSGNDSVKQVLLYNLTSKTPWNAASAVRISGTVKFVEWINLETVVIVSSEKIIHWQPKVKGRLLSEESSQDGVRVVYSGAELLECREVRSYQMAPDEKTALLAVRSGGSDAEVTTHYILKIRHRQLTELLNVDGALLVSGESGLDLIAVTHDEQDVAKRQIVITPVDSEVGIQGVLPLWKLHGMDISDLDGKWDETELQVSGSSKKLYLSCCRHGFAVFSLDAASDKFLTLERMADEDRKVIHISVHPLTGGILALGESHDSFAIVVHGFHENGAVRVQLVADQAARLIPFSTYRGTTTQRAATEALFSHHNLAGHMEYQDGVLSPEYFCREVFLSLNNCRMLASSDIVEVAGTSATKQLLSNSALLDSVPPRKDVVVTPNTEKNIQTILTAYMVNYPLVIEGCTAGGKTATVEYCASITNSPMLRLNLTPQMTIADVIGSLGFKDTEEAVSPAADQKPRLKRMLSRRQSTKTAEMKLEFKPGIFTKAVRDGYWLLLDEANLASDEILRIIEDVLQTGVLLIQSCMLAGQPDFIDGGLQYRQHPNFRLFMSQNPPDDKAYAGTRNTFSVSLLSHFIPVRFPSIPLYPDTLDIITTLLKKSATTDDAKSMAQRLMFLFDEAKDIPRTSAVPLSIRDVLQACGLLGRFKNDERQTDVPNMLYLLFSQHMTANNQKRAKVLIEKSIGPVKVKSVHEDQLPEKTAPLSIYGRLFELFDMAYATKRPAMVVGTQFSGKTCSIQAWASMRGLKTETFYLTFETATEDLFGRILPDSAGASPFRWVDGPVIRAMKSGTCLILSGLNQPEDAVLESLNAVLESGHEGRRLYMSNRAVDVSPKFCIFATYSKATAKESVKLTPALLSRFLCLDISRELVNADMNSLLSCYIAETSLRKPLLHVIKELTAKSKMSVGLGQLCILLRIAVKLWELAPGDRFLEHMTTVSEMLLFQKMKAGDVTEGHLLPFPINKDRFSEQGYFLSPSRHFLSTTIAMSIQLKVPLILQGPAGVGKTSLVKLVSKCLNFGDRTIIFSCNKETTVGDLMGNFVPSEGGCEFKSGPLCKAISEGYIFVADELNIMPPEVMGFLTPLLSYPEKFLNLPNSESLHVHKQFSFIATQNPPEYAGRNLLPKSLECRFMKVMVPEYSSEEIVDILVTKVPTLQQESSYLSADEIRSRVEYLVTSVASTSAGKTSGVSLRHYLKVLRRLVVLGDLFNSQEWKLLIHLHIECLFDSGGTSLAGNVSQISENWEFRISREGNPSCCIKTVWQGQADSSLPTPLLPGELLLLCKIAMAFYCKEPVVIEGTTCFKTQALYHFAEMVVTNPGCHTCVNVMYLSNLTDASDLFGRIEPHSPASYVKTYVRNLVGLLHSQIGADHGIAAVDEGSFKDLADYLEHFWTCVRKELTKDVREIDGNMADKLEREYDEKFFESYPGMEFFSSQSALTRNKRANSLLVFELLRTLNRSLIYGQGFPFCERGLMPQIRFGGIVVLKDINMPDQATVESLNTVSDLESEMTHPYDVEMPIEVSPRFFLASTIREPAFKPVSPALRSRYTFLKVKAPEMLSNEVRQFMVCYLAKKLGLRDEDSVVDYLFHFLKLFKEYFPTAYNQTTVHDLLKWAKFSKVELPSLVRHESALRFSWATQLVFLDNIESPRLAELLQKLQQLEFERLCISQDFISVHSLGSAIEEDVFSADPSNASEIFLTDAGILMKGSLEVFKEELVVTPKTISNLTRIILSNYTGNTMLLEGPPGVGKSKLPEVFASMMQMEFFRISCSGNMSAEDLFGTFIPTVDNESLVFQFEEGVLTKAMQMESGCIVLLDEINLASSEVLSTLIGVLKHPRERPFEVQGQRYDMSRVQFICAQNPPSVGGGRQGLPHSMKCLLSTVKVDSMDDKEIEQIIVRKYGRTFGSEENCNCIIKIHFSMASQLSAEVSNPPDFNLRDVQKLAALYRSLDARELQENVKLRVILTFVVYAERLGKEDTRQTARKFICQVYGVSEAQMSSREPVLAQLKDTFSVATEPYLSRATPRGLSIPTSGRLGHPVKYSRMLEVLYLAVQSKRVVNISGPPVSGKTTSVIELARLLNRKLLILAINSDTEIADLIGGFAPVDPRQPDAAHKTHVINLVMELLKMLPLTQAPRFIEAFGRRDTNGLKSIIMESQTDSAEDKVTALMTYLEEANLLPEGQMLATSFHFYPGPVLRAMTEGDLLLLDNVDLAKPQVIERLNSLGEDTSCLYSLEIGSEGGLKRYVSHAEFCCICTTNTSRNGAYSLSEAFRNRCIELHYDSFSDWSEKDLVEVVSFLDSTHLMCQPDEVHSAGAGLQIHKGIAETQSGNISGYSITLRNANHLLDNSKYIEDSNKAIRSAYGVSFQSDTAIQQPHLAGRNPGTDAVYDPANPTAFQPLKSGSTGGRLFRSTAGDCSVTAYLLSLTEYASPTMAAAFRDAVNLFGQIIDVSGIVLSSRDISIENDKQYIISVNAGAQLPLTLRRLGLSAMLMLNRIEVLLDRLFITGEGTLELTGTLQLKWSLLVSATSGGAHATLEMSKAYPTERACLGEVTEKLLLPWKSQFWPLKVANLQLVSFAVLHVKAVFTSPTDHSIVITLSESDETRIIPGEILLAKSLTIQLEEQTSGLATFEFQGDIQLSPILTLPFIFRNSEVQSSYSTERQACLKELLSSSLRMIDGEKIPEYIVTKELRLILHASDDGFDKVEVTFAQSNSPWCDPFGVASLQLSNIEGRISFTGQSGAAAALSGELQIVGVNAGDPIPLLCHIPASNAQLSLLWNLTNECRTSLLGSLVKSFTFPFAGFKGSATMRRCDIGVTPDDSLQVFIEWDMGTLAWEPLLSVTSGAFTAHLDLSKSFSGTLRILGIIETGFEVHDMSSSYLDITVQDASAETSVKNIVSSVLPSCQLSSVENIAWFCKPLKFDLKIQLFQITADGVSVDALLRTSDWTIVPQVLDLVSVELRIKQAEEMHLYLSSKIRLLQLNLPVLVLHLSLNDGDLKLRLQSRTKIDFTMKEMLHRLMNVAAAPRFMDEETQSGAVEEMTVDLESQEFYFIVLFEEFSLDLGLFDLQLTETAVRVDGNYAERSFGIQMSGKIGVDNLGSVAYRADLRVADSALTIVLSASFELNFIGYVLKKIIGDFLKLNVSGHSDLVLQVSGTNESRLQVDCSDLDFEILHFLKLKKATLDIQLDANMKLIRANLSGVLEIFQRCTATFSTKEISAQKISFEVSPLDISAALGFVMDSVLQGLGLPLQEMRAIQWFLKEQRMKLSVENLCLHAPSSEIDATIVLQLEDWKVFEKHLTLASVSASFIKKRAENWYVTVSATCNLFGLMLQCVGVRLPSDHITILNLEDHASVEGCVTSFLSAALNDSNLSHIPDISIGALKELEVRPFSKEIKLVLHLNPIHIFGDVLKVELQQSTFIFEWTASRCKVDLFGSLKILSFGGIAFAASIAKESDGVVFKVHADTQNINMLEIFSALAGAMGMPADLINATVFGPLSSSGLIFDAELRRSKMAFSIVLLVKRINIPFTSVIFMEAVEFRFKCERAPGVQDPWKESCIVGTLVLDNKRLPEFCIPLKGNSKQRWTLSLPKDLTEETLLKSKAQLTDSLSLSEIASNAFKLPLPDIGLSIDSVKFLGEWKNFSAPERIIFEMGLKELTVLHQPVQLTLCDPLLHLSYASERKLQEQTDILKSAMSNSFLRFSVILGSPSQRQLVLQDCKMLLPSKDSLWRLTIPNQKINFGIMDMIALWNCFDCVSGDIQSADIPIDLVVKNVYMNLTLDKRSCVKDLEFEAMVTIKPRIALEPLFEFIGVVIQATKCEDSYRTKVFVGVKVLNSTFALAVNRKTQTLEITDAAGTCCRLLTTSAQLSFGDLYKSFRSSVDDALDKVDDLYSKAGTISAGESTTIIVSRKEKELLIASTVLGVKVCLMAKKSEKLEVFLGAYYPGMVEWGRIWSGLKFLDDIMFLPRFSKVKLFVACSKHKERTLTSLGRIEKQLGTIFLPTNVKEAGFVPPLVALGATVTLPNEFPYSLLGLGNVELGTAILIIDKERPRLSIPIENVKLGELILDYCAVQLSERNISFELGLTIQLPQDFKFSKFCHAAFRGVLEIKPIEQLLRAGIELTGKDGESAWPSPFGLSFVALNWLKLGIVVSKGAPSLDFGASGTIFGSTIGFRVTIGPELLPLGAYVCYKSISFQQFFRFLFNITLPGWLDALLPQIHESHMLILLPGTGMTAIEWPVVDIRRHSAGTNCDRIVRRIDEVGPALKFYMDVEWLKVRAICWGGFSSAERELELGIRLKEKLDILGLLILSDFQGDGPPFAYLGIRLNQDIRNGIQIKMSVRVRFCKILDVGADVWLEDGNLTIKGSLEFFGIIFEARLGFGPTTLYAGALVVNLLGGGLSNLIGGVRNACTNILRSLEEKMDEALEELERKKRESSGIAWLFWSICSWVVSAARAVVTGIRTAVDWIGRCIEKLLEHVCTIRKFSIEGGTKERGTIMMRAELDACLVGIEIQTGFEFQLSIHSSSSSANEIAHDHIAREYSRKDANNNGGGKPVEGPGEGDSDYAKKILGKLDKIEKELSDAINEGRAPPGATLNGECPPQESGEQPLPPSDEQPPPPPESGEHPLPPSDEQPPPPPESGEHPLPPSDEQPPPPPESGEQPPPSDDEQREQPSPPPESGEHPPPPSDEQGKKTPPPPVSCEPESDDEKEPSPIDEQPADSKEEDKEEDKKYDILKEDLKRQTGEEQYLSLPVSYYYAPDDAAFPDTVEQFVPVNELEVERIFIPQQHGIQFPLIRMEAMNETDKTAQVEEAAPTGAPISHSEQSFTGFPTAHTISELDLEAIQRVDKTGDSKEQEDSKDVTNFFEEAAGDSEEEPVKKENAFDAEASVATERPNEIDMLWPLDAEMTEYLPIEQFTHASILEAYRKQALSVLTELLDETADSAHGLTAYQQHPAPNTATILVDFSLTKSCKPHLLVTAMVLTALNYKFQILLTGDRLLSEPIALKA